MRMRVAHIISLALGLLCGLVWAQSALAADKRVALIIGNSAYQNAPTLPNPARDARAIVAELRKFSRELAAKPRWLVLNKRDLLPPADAEKRAHSIVRRLRYRGPYFLISGATGEGTGSLCEAVMRFLEEHDRAARERASCPAGAAGEQPDAT